MLDFIKNLFKPKVEKKEIKLDKLESWFKEQIKEKVEGVRADLASMFSRFDGEINRLKENLAALEKAQLQNPNISTREKQIMEGNRQAYIKKVSAFINTISLEKNPRRVQEFCVSFEDSLNELSRTISKQYFVLQEFFANESKRISQNIKNLDRLVKEIRSLMEREEVKQIENIERGIKNIFSRIELNENLKKELIRTEKEVKEDEKGKENIVNEIEKMKNSEEMGDLEKWKRELEDLDEKINRLKGPFLHDFAVIEAALKKYSKIALDEKTVLYYLENPINKLLKDTDFKILKVFENKKENINKCVIELKDKKKGKTLQTIDRMDRAYFEDFLKKYDGFITKKENLNKRIEENKVKERIKEENFKLDGIKERIEIKSERIQKLKADLENTEVDDLIRDLERHIRGVTNIELRILI